MINVKKERRQSYFASPKLHNELHKLLKGLLEQWHQLLTYLPFSASASRLQLPRIDIVRLTERTSLQLAKKFTSQLKMTTDNVRTYRATGGKGGVKYASAMGFEQKSFPKRS